MNEKTIEQNIIDVDDADNLLLEEVKKYMGDKIYECLQCGTCTSGCPMTPFGYNIRKIVKLVVLGFKEELIEGEFIWFCSECGKCGERCPHGLKDYNLISILRRLSIESGHVPPSYKHMIKKIQSTGKITEVNEAVNLKRERCGLPKLENKLDNETLDEIRIILTKTGIMKKIDDADKKNMDK
ncbi:MAG: 4Fe-4S dicluster domain-containing protein [Candidatus Helarchaeota archaeon]